MAFTVSISLTFPALTDTDVWFANAAAFNDFMSQGAGTATFSDVAANSIYVPVPYNAALAYQNFQIDGVDHVVPSKAQFDSLVAQVSALEASYEDLRTAMYNAGLITHAQ